MGAGAAAVYLMGVVEGVVMAHSDEIGDFVIHHDNYEGFVSFRCIADKTQSLLVPMSVLREFVGRAIAAERIRAIESMSGDEIIGTIERHG